MKKVKLENYLKKFNQKQLLTYYDELNNNEKEQLYNEILHTNLKLMNKLYKNSFFDKEINVNKISNLKCIISLNKQDKEKYKQIGINTIKNGKYAIVIMAGGNASRLGLNGPKGCLELDINDKKISLFETFINQLKEIYIKYNTYINIYIMTSTSNKIKTEEFFMKKNYFDYPKEHVKFFCQNNLPILDKSGKILLKDKSHILYGPNGNGDVFQSLKNNNLINDMENKKIKYVLFSTVDNILTNLIDFNFIGCTIYNDYELATKTITKKDENEKDWIFCKYNNKPFMLPTKYITKELTNIMDNNGNYLYREKNITYHLISLNNIKQFSKKNMNYHRAYKKNKYFNLNNQYVIPNEPNSFKFEKFIFDAFYYTKNMLLYRVDENEFCPIKKLEDIKKAEDKFNKK